MNRFFALAIGLGIFCWSTSAATADQPPLATLADGPSFHGEFWGADAAQWQFRFGEADATREIAANDLVSWGGFVDATGPIQIILAQGGVIVASSLKLEKDQLNGESPLFSAFQLPLELVAGIIFRPPLDRAGNDQMIFKILSPAGQTDRVLLDNGDELSGAVTSLVDDVLSLTAETGKINVDAKKLAAIIFNPTLLHKPRASGLRVLVGYQDGSRVPAIFLSANKNAATVKLAGAAELTSSTATIVALQVFGGRAVYLSDLNPATYRHIPYLDLTWPYQVDRSVRGSYLRTPLRLVPKGLGMHSPARLTYDLDGAYRRFQAEVAIDAECGQRGSVVFRVFTDDGKGNWQQRATSKVVRGGDPPEEISVDLTGARRMSLLVDFADRGDELDHADWLNARLIR